MLFNAGSFLEYEYNCNTMNVNGDKIKITKDFLEKEDFKKLKETLCSNCFPWHISGILSDSSYEELNHYKNTQMAHTFYADHSPNSNYIDLINPILTKINPLSILNIKVNLNFRTNETVIHGMHVDYSLKNIQTTTGIFFINTTNAYTFFENGAKIENIENTLIEFPNYLKHSGSTNTCEHPFRIVLNLNYLKDEISSY